MAIFGFHRLQAWTDSFDGAFCASLSPQDPGTYRLLYLGGMRRSKVLYCQDHEGHTTAFVDIAEPEATRLSPGSETRGGRARPACASWMSVIGMACWVGVASTPLIQVGSVHGPDGPAAESEEPDIHLDHGVGGRPSLRGRARSKNAPQRTHFTRSREPAAASAASLWQCESGPERLSAV